MARRSSTAIGIIAAVVIIAVSSVWNDAPIVDEVPHIGAGYTYVKKGSLLFNPEHPPLPKDLAGLPLLTLDIDQTIYNRTYEGNWGSDVNGQWNFGRTLIFHSGVDATAMVHRAKLPMLFFFITSAWLVFHWARKRYSPSAGLLALFLFAFSPTVIAHSRLVTTDIPALWGVLVATYFFVRWLKDPGDGWRSRNFWLAALAFGFAQLAKFSLFLLWPYLLLVAVIWGFINGYVFKTAWRGLLTMIVGFIVVIGPVYQLHLINYEGFQQKSDAVIILKDSPYRQASDLVIWASYKPVLRPYAAYAMGLLMVFQRASGGNTTYFLGDVYTSADKLYFPIVYALKEPIPFLILLLLAIVAAFAHKNSKRNRLRGWLADHFDETVMLIWIALYWGTSITANLNIGVRHMLPVYGFTAILIAGQFDRIKTVFSATRHKFFVYRVSMIVLLGWLAIETLSIFPYYLTYFNQFALIRPSWTASQDGYVPGGHNYVVDSNLHWGQDLKRLADWAEKNNVQRINLDYFGWADQTYYLKDRFFWMTRGRYTTKEEFLIDNPQGGYVAISATYYQESLARDRKYGWLEDMKPTVIIGNSIFVWHITP